MIFQFMLYGFHVALKTAVTLAKLRNKAFRTRLKERDMLIQVVMSDGKKGRYYKLNNGKLKSAAKVLSEEPDIVLEWKDASTALKTLIKFTPKGLVESIFNAISNGNLMVSCDVDDTVWFGLIMKDMLNVYRGAGAK